MWLMAQDERTGLAKLLRNGTAALSVLFLSASLGMHYVSSRNENQAKNLPAFTIPLRQQNTSNSQLAFAFFGAMFAGLAGVSQYGLKKLQAAESQPPANRP
jgi:hypothetical protein